MLTFKNLKHDAYIKWLYSDENEFRYRIVTKPSFYKESELKIWRVMIILKTGERKKYWSPVTYWQALGIIAGKANKGFYNFDVERINGDRII